MKYSFIIPVYNAANTIGRCIESILGNTFKDFEILLIDDCSKDESLKICRDYEKKFDQIRVFHNEVNKGVSYTRNVGLEHAEGEYLLFTDSDDWIEKNYIESFDHALGINDLFAVCGFYNHDEKYNGRLDTYQWKDIDGIQSVKLHDYMEDMFQRTLLQQLWNKAFKNDIVKKNNIRFDESISIGEDFRFILSYLKAADVKDMVIINEPLYHYMRDQAGSLMFHVGYESIEEPLKNKRMYYSLLGKEEYEIDQLMAEERTKQEDLYAYLIMHNGDMALKEKKRLVLNLNEERGKELYRHHHILCYKEQISRILKKMISCIKRSS